MYFFYNEQSSSLHIPVPVLPQYEWLTQQLTLTTLLININSLSANANPNLTPNPGKNRNRNNFGLHQI